MTKLGCPMSDFRCLETDLAWSLFGPCFPLSLDLSLQCSDHGPSTLSPPSDWKFLGEQPESAAGPWAQGVLRKQLRNR